MWFQSTYRSPFDLNMIRYMIVVIAQPNSMDTPISVIVSIVSSLCVIVISMILYRVVIVNWSH